MAIRPLKYNVYIRLKSKKYLFEDNYDFVGFEKIKNPFLHWCADPFVIKKDDKVIVFAEICNKITNKGFIGYYVIEPRKKSKWQKCLKTNKHLSFPNIFFKDGHYFMMPESSQASSVDVYISNYFPQAWSHYKNLMKNVRYVDSIMDLANNAFISYSEQDNCLLYYRISNDNCVLPPLSLVDYNYSLRQAGQLIKYKESLLLPTQDCKERYGGGIIFNDFAISKNSFSVKRRFEIKYNDPKLLQICKSPYGVHTYNRYDDVEVIDIQVKTINLFSILGKIIRGFKLIFKWIQQRKY